MTSRSETKRRKAWPMSAEAIARLRRCIESADRLKVVCPPGYVSPRVDDLRALLDAHAARTAAAVAAATKPLADRIAELEYERAGHVLVSFSAYDVMSRAERDRDALRASWREAVEVAERNAIDCAHLRHSAIALEAERDALFVSHANLAAVLADINEAVGGASGEEPSLVRVVRLVVAERDALGDSLEGCHDALEGAEADNDALRALVEAARKYAERALGYGDDFDAAEFLAAMDVAKSK